MDTEKQIEAYVLELILKSGVTDTLGVIARINKEFYSALVKACENIPVSQQDYESTIRSWLSDINKRNFWEPN